MRRKLYTFAAALSLTLCVSIVALWVRGYWRSDSLSRRAFYFDPDGRLYPGGLVGVNFQGAGLALSRVRPVEPLPPERRARSQVDWLHQRDMPVALPAWAWLWGHSFRDGHTANTPAQSIASHTVFVPYWP